jgi:hypothetical protein
MALACQQGELAKMARNIKGCAREQTSFSVRVPARWREVNIAGKDQGRHHAPQNCDWYGSVRIKRTRERTDMSDKTRGATNLPYKKIQRCTTLIIIRMVISNEQTRRICVCVCMCMYVYVCVCVCTYQHI